jgi:hypothetical protein
MTDPAALAESFGPDVSACISSGDDTRCTDVDLIALSGFGTAAAASVQLGAPALVVDETTDSMLIVSRQDVTAALRLPVGALIDGVSRRRSTSTARMSTSSCSPHRPTESVGVAR